MQAKHVATMLSKAGFDVRKILEPNQNLDGLVAISDALHIQVPLRGRALNVVQETESGLVFGEVHEDFETVLRDVHAAQAGRLHEFVEED